MEKQDTSQTYLEYVKGITGGILFSLPLLYTMEVWWTGFIASPFQLLCFFLASFVLLVAYNNLVGIQEDVSLKSVLWDSVEEMGIAVVISSVFLLMISKIGPGMSFQEIFGKVIIESFIVAIGISVGKAQLGQDDDSNSGKSGSKSQLYWTSREVVISVCGAVLIAFNVAPTKEILVIAVSATAVHLFAIVLMTLILSGAILYLRNRKDKGSNWEIATDLSISYISALTISFFLLWIFNRIEGFGFYIVLSEVIVLALPAAIGASAGRLLLEK